MAGGSVPSGPPRAGKVDNLVAVRGAVVVVADSAPRYDDLRPGRAPESPARATLSASGSDVRTRMSDDTNAYSVRRDRQAAI